MLHERILEFPIFSYFFCFLSFLEALPLQATADWAAVVTRLAADWGHGSMNTVDINLNVHPHPNSTSVSNLTASVGYCKVHRGNQDDQVSVFFPHSIV